MLKIVIPLVVALVASTPALAQWTTCQRIGTMYSCNTTGGGSFAGGFATGFSSSFANSMNLIQRKQQMELQRQQLEIQRRQLELERLRHARAAPDRQQSGLSLVETPIILADTDFRGGDYDTKGAKGIELSKCLEHCVSIESCKGVAWVERNSWCWPKHALGGKSPSPGILSVIVRQ